MVVKRAHADIMEGRGVVHEGFGEGHGGSAEGVGHDGQAGGGWGNRLAQACPSSGERSSQVLIIFVTAAAHMDVLRTEDTE